jgi:hypothetical protein
MPTKRLRPTGPAESTNLPVILLKQRTLVPTLPFSTSPSLPEQAHVDCYPFQQEPTTKGAHSKRQPLHCTAWHGMAWHGPTRLGYEISLVRLFTLKSAVLLSLCLPRYASHCVETRRLLAVTDPGNSDEARNTNSGQFPKTINLYLSLSLSSPRVMIIRRRLPTADKEITKGVAGSLWGWWSAGEPGGE